MSIQADGSFPTLFAQGPQGGPPSSPPNFTPPQPQSQQFGATPLAIDQGAIRPCLIDLYIYGQEEEMVSGHGLHLWGLDLYQVSAGIEILGDFSEWI